MDEISARAPVTLCGLPRGGGADISPPPDPLPNNPSFHPSKFPRQVCAHGQWGVVTPSFSHPQGIRPPLDGLLDALVFMRTTMRAGDSEYAPGPMRTVYTRGAAGTSEVA